MDSLVRIKTIAVTVSDSPQISGMKTTVSRVAELCCRTLRQLFITSVAISWVFSTGGLNSHANLYAAVEFNRDIRPILAENCFACHGSDSESREGDLRLDQRAQAIASGAIVAGHPDTSELINRLITDDPDLVMPPLESKKSLTAEQKNLLKQWIAEGAEYESHWAFVSAVRPVPPNVQSESWPRNAVDQFVLANLEANELSPAPAADHRTLFRRLHLDITGLPPAPSDIEAFVREMKSNSEQALSAWIDRLMESSAWGEHRARYWLDAARYGDTHGLHFDNYREMWPYRDWVIRAFNANQPFDQFTVEQLAGDLLPDPTDDQLIATGFQRCNITTNEGGTIDEENLANYAADRVQTFGWVYLGLTTNCSQCHDHKFDPLTMKDYYSLAAYFRNTTQQAKDGNVKDGKGPVLVVPTEADQPRWAVLSDQIAAAQKRRSSRRTEARPEFEQWLSSLSPEVLAQRVPTKALQVHLPLTEGEGNVIRGLCAPDQQYQTAGDIKWIPEGKLGPAPVIAEDSTLDLGKLGDFELNDEFSFGVWTRTAKNNADGAIIARMDEQAGHRGWDLSQLSNSFQVHLVSSWPENAIRVEAPKDVVKPGEWHHVFVSWDGSGQASGVRMYIDGKLVSLKIDVNSIKENASIRTETPLRIGQRSQRKLFKDGAVQDFRVYERMLTAEEVRSLASDVPLTALISTPATERTPQQKQAIFDYYLSSVDTMFMELESKVASLEAEKQEIQSRSAVTHIQREQSDSPAMAHVLMRGAYDKPGAEVIATTPAALHPLRPDAAPNRLGLAEWVVTPANPLTARVTVNRFWQEVFGRGIVATPEDFGVMGSPPSHPELLDWLAVEFRENGWDVKAFFKMMFMSATYRQAAKTTAEKLERDRDNVLLSRGPRFRMDAEMVRDYALSASGLLSGKMYGPGTKPYQPKGIWSIVGLPGGNTRDYVQDTGEDLYRRTLYSFWKRMAPPPNLEAFNAPSREVCTVRRERTNTPLQALVTLNDPQFVEAARYLAEQVVSPGVTGESGILNQIASRVLGRSFTTEEVDVLLKIVNDLRHHYTSSPRDAEALVNVGDTKPDTKIDAATLATWTMVCNQIMNLDEALSK